MRFCHVTTFYPPYNFGGDGILVQQICEGLARRGHEVDVVHCEDAYRLKGGRAQPEIEDPPGIRRHVLKSGWGALSPLITQQTGLPGLKARRLREILSSEYDVVHFHNVSLVGGPGVLPLSRANVTLYTTHDHWLVCPTHVLWKFRNRPCDGPQCFRCSLRSGIPPQLWRSGRMIERSLARLDAILAPSRFAAEQHRRIGTSVPIEVFPSFSKVPGAGDSPAPKAGRPLFVCAGRIEASKGIESALEAFRQRPGYDLAVAGTGEQEPRLRDAYSDCGNIRFLGHLSHDETAALMRSATAVVSPTWGPESFPLVIIEALACGTPAICRRAGGSAEAIEKHGGGLVYDDPGELLPLVDRLATEPELRAELAVRARQGYEDDYSEERWMERYFALIESIASSRPRGSNAR